MFYAFLDFSLRRLKTFLRCIKLLKRMQQSCGLLRRHRDTTANCALQLKIETKQKKINIKKNSDVYPPLQPWPTVKERAELTKQETVSLALIASLIVFSPQL